MASKPVFFDTFQLGKAESQGGKACRLIRAPERKCVWYGTGKVRRLNWAQGKGIFEKKKGWSGGWGGGQPPQAHPWIRLRLVQKDSCFGYFS